MNTHIEHLFSAAYDDELRGAERTRFDDHLAVCTDCHAAFAHFRASVDGLRSLPHAVMPVTVHLPSSAPAAATSPFWQRLRVLPTRVRAGVATVAVAVIAAVTALGLSHGAPAATTATVPMVAAPGNGVTHDGVVPGGAFIAAPAMPCTPGVISDGTTAVPDTFGNVVTRSDASRPGQTLQLATPDMHVSAGAHVLVYARLTPSAARPGAAVVPCVTLQVGAAATPLTAAGPAEGTTSLTTGAQGVYAAVPTQSVDVAGEPLLTVTVPPNLPSGTVLTLRAQVPAGYPQGGGAALTADLTVIVS